jgi:hypothetical protein
MMGCTCSVTELSGPDLKIAGKSQSLHDSGPDTYVREAVPRRAGPRGLGAAGRPSSAHPHTTHHTRAWRQPSPLIPPQPARVSANGQTVIATTTHPPRSRRGGVPQSMSCTRAAVSLAAVGTITHTAATVEVRAANLVRMMRTGTEEGGRGGGAAHVRKRHSALHQLLPTLSDACGSPVRPAGS